MILLAQVEPFAHAYHNATTLHPLGLAAVLALGLMTLCVSRSWAIMPMVIMACFVASAQRIVVGGIDFSLLRILVLFAWTRVLIRQEYVGFRWQALDLLIVAWAVVKATAYTALRGDGASLIFMLGQSYDLLGMYFFFRCVLSTWDDVRRLCTILAVIAIPLAAAFLIEKLTGRNGFAIFGGVSEYTPVRLGKRRAMGAFPHPIIAGCFWAAMLPLVASLFWTDRSRRWLAIAGSVCAMAIILFTASSTPLAAVGFTLLGACLFPARLWLRWIRWGTVAMLIGLHFVMNKPVWHLLARIDLVGGSTGWHRYFLIDNAIRHFDEWAFLGTISTGHWGHQMFDVTNQYVLEGVRGGAATLALFIATIVAAFRCVGAALANAPSRAELVLAWAIGVSLFTHAGSFLAVSYFGQGTLAMFLTLALAGSISCTTQRQAIPAPARSASLSPAPRFQYAYAP